MRTIDQIEQWIRDAETDGHDDVSVSIEELRLLIDIARKARAFRSGLDPEARKLCLSLIEAEEKGLFF